MKLTTVIDTVLPELTAVDLMQIVNNDLPDDERFCSLDHIAELPAEHSDPFEIVARRERLFDCPLAFHAYETNPAVTELTTNVRII